MLDSDCSTPLEATPSKTCRKCGETKAIDQFPAARHQCIECRRAYQRAYYAANRERALANMKRWHDANRESVAAYQRRYWEGNRDRLSEYRRDWYNENKDRSLARMAEYRRANKARIKAGKFRHYMANRAHYLAYQQEWRKKNPDAVLDRVRRRQARKMGAPVVDKINRSELWERDGGKCHLCGKRCDPNNWHADHLVPLSLGGSHTMANLAVSHPTCNLRRNNTGSAQLRLIG